MGDFRCGKGFLALCGSGCPHLFSKPDRVTAHKVIGFCLLENLVEHSSCLADVRIRAAIAPHHFQEIFNVDGAYDGQGAMIKSLFEHTQVSVLMSMLFSDLYYSDPIDLGETKEHADELSVLLQVTSYDEIPHFNDIANKLIEISKNVESRPAFSEQTIELFQSFIYNLGKPLSDDIDTLSTSLYESIMSESVEG